MPSNPCVICFTLSDHHRRAAFDGPQIDCPRCGEFEIIRSAVANLHVFPRPNEQGRLGPERAKLSGWIRERNDLRDPPRIMSADVDRIALLPDKPLMARAERLLLKVIGKAQGFGAVRRLNDPELIATVYGRSDGDVRGFCDLLQARGWSERSLQSGEFSITPEGYMHADKLRHQAAPSSIGFVAMWFAEEMRPAYNDGLAQGVRAAGYDPRRVDDVEHTGKIDDEIIAQIRASRFVVADFTGHRGGVYFEAGFALSLGLPVIWTCRKDELGKLHFDTRQYAFIDWQGAEELR